MFRPSERCAWPGPASPQASGPLARRIPRLGRPAAIPRAGEPPWHRWEDAVRSSARSLLGAAAGHGTHRPALLRAHAVPGGGCVRLVFRCSRAGGSCAAGAPLRDSFPLGTAMRCRAFWDRQRRCVSLAGDFPGGRGAETRRAVSQVCWGLRAIAALVVVRYDAPLSSAPVCQRARATAAGWQPLAVQPTA